MKSLKITALGLAASLGMAASLPALSAQLLIDDFSQDNLTGALFAESALVAGGAAPTGFQLVSGGITTGTTLTNVVRSLSVEAFGTTTNPNQTISSTAGFGSLSVNNDVGINGVAELDYTFDAIDLTQGGANTALILDVLSIDLNTQVNLRLASASGTSESGIQSFNGPGEFFRLFTGFTPLGGTGADPTAATGLNIEFTGVDEAWDGDFRFLATNVPTEVPEPAVLALFGAGLAGMGIATRRRRNKQPSA